MLSTLLELAGFVCLSVASFRLSPGFACTGVILVFVGYCLDGVKIDLPKIHLPRRAKREHRPPA